MLFAINLKSLLNNLICYETFAGRKTVTNGERKRERGEAKGKEREVVQVHNCIQYYKLNLIHERDRE